MPSGLARRSRRASVAEWRRSRDWGPGGTARFRRSGVGGGRFRSGGGEAVKGLCGYDVRAQSTAGLDGATAIQRVLSECLCTVSFRQACVNYSDPISVGNRSVDETGRTLRQEAESWPWIDFGCFVQHRPLCPVGGYSTKDVDTIAGASALRPSSLNTSASPSVPSSRPIGAVSMVRHSEEARSRCRTAESWFCRPIPGRRSNRLS
jgi:hypothetical protein